MTHDHDHSSPNQSHNGHDHDDHGHDHNNHDHDHNHDDHNHGSGIWGWLGSFFHAHGHHGQQSLVTDSAFAGTNAGIRTVWIALGLLGLTTIIQLLFVLRSGSVALLADTIHNFGDALNSIPLLIAFYLSRRRSTRRYTYGFARAEDVAGIFIVVSIAVSAGIIFWESIQKLINPSPMTNLGWVALSGVIGFLGNEGVAFLQIRTGRAIGSAALVADGMHARTDGFTSLAVVGAAFGTWLGFPMLDPIIGLVIGVTILFITWDAIKTMWYRLMDAIDPEVVSKIEHLARGVHGVVDLERLRVRWAGHQLYAEFAITVDEDLPTTKSYSITEDVRHALFHDMPHLAAVIVEVQPCGHGGRIPRQTAHHEHPSLRSVDSTLP